jgi:thymidylate synthase
MILGIGFTTAQEAFEVLYQQIHLHGEDRGNDTHRITNVGFTIFNPRDNHIQTGFRKWNPKYAEREWRWYLSQDRDVTELAKYAPIWDKMHDGDGIVNSNYGYQWNRNDQLDKCIEQLVENDRTRQAWLTIMDGKEKHLQKYDTPCTLSIGFEISNSNRLNMSVLMRSNDLWYGFCNDQYCFSLLQIEVANKLGIKVGTYYHYAADMHLYNDKMNKKDFVKS